MRISNKHIKSKVVIGFTLAFSIIAIAIYLTYNSFTQLLSSVTVLSQPNAKLAKLQHTLADIATAEGSIRAYTLTTEERHFKEYLENLGTVNNQIDSLRYLMQDNPAELAQIDSISALLLAKKKSMEQHVAIKRQNRDRNSYSDKALQQITSSASEQATTTINQRTTTTISDRLAFNEDAPPAQQESKKGILSRLFSKRADTKPKEQEPPVPIVVPQIDVKQEYTTDTSKARATKVASIAKVRNVLNKVQREVQKQEDALVAKELALLQQDKQIMDQIRSMIYDLEKHELQQARLSSEKAREVAGETSLVLLLVGIFGLVSGIAFIIVILRDLTRSSKYKAELRRSRKEAIQLARAKESFVANISHEIRTPLNVVLGFSEQLTRTALQPQQQEHLQAIHSAGEHLLHIVNDVLDLSKLEAGKLYLHLAPFEIKHLLDEVERTFRLKASTKGIGFSCSMDEHLHGHLLGDCLRLKQVLFNLVDNAIKFTHEGEVNVRCRLKSQRRGRVVVLIEVSDTGIGIPMEQTAHVFGEFNQADDSIIRKYGGTGLGLSISKKLVEMQEGSLTLRSTPNQGTTFSIVLPMKRVTAEAESAIAPQVLQGTAAADVLAGKSVLVIDDDAYSRMLCQLILRRWGMQVTLANDGQQALDVIQTKHFDVVLTDIQLPGMSGKAVSKAIRKENATVPILALTANIMSSNRRFFAKTPISDHLLKPFTEQELHQKLSKALVPAAIPDKTETVSSTVALRNAKASLYTLDEIRAFAGDDEETVRAVLEVLVADNRKNLAQLQEAVDSQNWRQVGELAHKMKTAFQHLQAHTVLPALDTFEQLLHQPQPQTATLPAIAQQLQHDAAEVLAALASELEPSQITADTIA
ncbi:response regulator [Pontibacter sp. JH31]|uniref:histidine kinase n=1 Tax=Pontibacter aquaedesilientis TaxID=2766980 RepID=A0ABR7XI21_9BACT|nr:ATP-binding protein [Pontibacter aquaedesilientis]MBD1397288.1 response regulator [Pontibacter aquaedesilientis]